MGDDDIRVGCAKQFATLEATLSNLTTTIADFKSTSSRVTRMEESTKGLWKEIREDIMPELKAIPKDVRESLDKHREEIARALGEHAKDCPARIKAMKRAVDHDSGDHVNPFAARADATGQVDTRAALAEPRRSLLPVSPTVVRWLLYVGLVIGSAIATLVTTLTTLELVGDDDKASATQSHRSQRDKTHGQDRDTDQAAARR